MIRCHYLEWTTIVSLNITATFCASVFLQYFMVSWKELELLYEQIFGLTAESVISLSRQGVESSCRKFSSLDRSYCSCVINFIQTYQETKNSISVKHIINTKIKYFKLEWKIKSKAGTEQMCAVLLLSDVIYSPLLCNYNHHHLDEHFSEEELECLFGVKWVV